MNKAVRVAATALVLVTAVVASVASSSGDPSAQVDGPPTGVAAPAAGPDDASPEADASAPAATPAAVGETVTTESWQLLVNGVTDPQPPESTFLKPDDGHHYVSADVTLTWSGKVSTTFSAVQGFQLQDSTSANFGPQMTEIEPKNPEGEFAPGQSRRGLVVFEVPDDASGLVLNFAGPGLRTAYAQVKLP